MPERAVPSPLDDLTAVLLAELAARGLTVAVAESLTGGQLTAELTRPAGASTVVLGGAVVYATPLKHTLTGVDEGLLAEHGPVHPEVAAQLARGIRTALAVDGRPASIGLSTTGVAGPEPQGGQPVGTVFVGIALGEDCGNETRVLALHLDGDRAAIRDRTVHEAVSALRRVLAGTSPARRE